MRVADNLALRAREYTISLKGAEIARYELPQGCQLAISSARGAPPPEGRRPASQRSAYRPGGSPISVRKKPAPPASRWLTL